MLTTAFPRGPCNREVIKAQPSGALVGNLGRSQADAVFFFFFFFNWVRQFLIMIVYYYYYFIFCLFRALHEAYGWSQASGRIRVQLLAYASATAKPDLSCNTYVAACSNAGSFFFGFLGPHPRHMEVPRLGVEWEL